LNRLNKKQEIALAAVFCYAEITMLKIYMARHGQDQDNANGILNGRRNTPLTQIGLGQAHALAESIKQSEITFDAVYASPLQRALVTAQTIAAIAGTPEPVVLEGLIERDFGVMSGQPTASIAERCAPDIIQAEIITYFLHPEGAETFPDLIARANLVLGELTKMHPDGSILLVTHGDFGKMIYAAFYKLPWEEELTKFHFGNSELLLLSEESSADQAHVFKQAQFNH
jgi:probable phosphoglycerate mutase